MPIKSAVIEVTKKLEGMGMIPQAIDQIIGHLIQENYLNESRFAQSFARGKFRIKNGENNALFGSLNNDNFLTLPSDLP